MAFSNVNSIQPWRYLPIWMDVRSSLVVYSQMNKLYTGVSLATLFCLAVITGNAIFYCINKSKKPKLEQFELKPDVARPEQINIMDEKSSSGISNFKFF